MLIPRLGHVRNGTLKTFINNFLNTALVGSYLISFDFFLFHSGQSHCCLLYNCHYFLYFARLWSLGPVNVVAWRVMAKVMEGILRQFASHVIFVASISKRSHESFYHPYSRFENYLENDS